MAGTLGTIYGQVQIDAKQAIAAYAALRAANASTLYALRGGATAFIAAGAAIGGVGVAISAAFVVAIKKAAEFERQLDFFGAVSNSTADQMEKVRAKALQLGKDTIFSAGQIADSFVELGKAGISADQIIGGVGEAVASLGAAADIPLDTAANIITSAVQTFKLGADQAVHVADLLAGAANASIVEVEDLGVSLKYVGGVAASISIPIEDTIDAISLLGKAGIRGSTAGTSLRQIMVSLTGTSKKASGVLKELGIITEDGANLFFTAAGKAKPLSEIFQILKDKTEGLTEAQRLSAFKTIFNNRALAAANILTRDGAAGFAEMNKEISKTTAADVARKRLDNLSGDIEILKGNIETLAIEAGAPFQEFLRGIVQGATKLLVAFSSLSPGTQELIFKIVALTGVIFVIMGTVITVVGLIFKFYESMILLKGGFTVVMTVLKSLRTAMAATWLAALGPIALIIAAIAILAVAFVIAWKKSETFRDVVKGVGAAIVDAFWAVIHFFQGLPDMLAGVWSTVIGGFVSAKNAIVGAWNAVGAFFSNLWTTITTAVIAFGVGFVNFFIQLPGRVLSFVQGMIASIVAFFMGLPEQVAYALGFLIGRSLRLLFDFGVASREAIGKAITAIVAFFQALPGRVVSFLTAMVTSGLNKLNQFVSFSKTFGANMLNAIVSFFQQLPGRVLSFLIAMYNGAVTKLNSFTAAAKSFGLNVLTSIVSFFGQLPGKVAGFLQAMYTAAVGKLASLVRFAGESGVKIKNGVIDAIKGLPGLVGDIISKMLNAFSDFGQRAFQKAKDIGSNLWNGFKDGMGIHSPSYIEKAMFQVTQTMEAETKNIAKKVETLQGLGTNLPNIQEMVTATRNAQGERLSASTSSTRLGSASGSPYVLTQAPVKTEINLTTINPVGETTVETLSKEGTRMGQLGLLPV